MNQLSRNKTWKSARISGKEISRLMRRHGWTIHRLAQKMGITQKRVKDVRKKGISGSNYVRDWLEAITGIDPGKRNPAYKGYRIGSTLMGETFIEKGGHHISWANNVTDAKKIIDRLTKPAKKTTKNLVLEKYSAAARAYIARIIRRELKAGVPFNQAVAMAHSEARRRGYKVPPRPNPNAWKELISTPRRKKTNPRGGVLIGEAAESLVYRGGRGKKKKSRWVHKFETPVEVLGMSDGSIKLKSKNGFKLWDWF